MEWAESIQGIKDDMKEVKDSLKEIKTVLSSFGERFISNEKDLERMINEYMRINSDYKLQIDSLRCETRAQDDLIWAEIRRKEVETSEKIKEAVKNGNRDVKLWLALTVITAIAAVVSKYL